MIPSAAVTSPSDLERLSVAPIRSFAAEERVYRAGDRMSLREEWRDLMRYRTLLRRLVHRDLTVRYKRSALGFLWTMLHPLILMVILTLVFATIFRFGLRNYALYLLSALIGWHFFSQTVIEAMTSMRWNGSLMKQVRVPRTVFVLSTTLAGLAHMGLALLALFAIMLLLRAPITPAVAFLPVSFLILGVFTLGISMIASALAVFFTDIREMIQAFLPAVMYLTPIIYPMSILPERFAALVRLNPLLYLFDLLRAPLYAGALPSTTALLVATASALVSIVIGWLVFRRLAPRFYPYL